MFQNVKKQNKKSPAADKKKKKDEEYDENEYDFFKIIGEESPEAGKKEVKVKLAEADAAEDSNGWFNSEEEGQLAVDVYQDQKNIYIRSTIAGACPEDIDISINNDMITIRGRRHEEEEVKEENYFYRECYWGGFSRSIILPEEVKTDQVKAKIKSGVLTITLPKTKKSRVVNVKVKEEE